jgi:DNA-binding MarR family transcriptional regulator
MNETVTTTRTEYIASIDKVIRQITWQSHKQLLQTLSRPEISLTMPQMVTLFAIRNVGTCRMSELAEITQQSAGTLTGIVDRLIEDHLVGRVRDIDDRRVVQVTLTAQGEERLACVEQARYEDMERMLRHMRLGQLADLDSLLHLLLNGIHELLSGGETLTLNRRVPTTTTTNAYPPFQGA